MSHLTFDTETSGLWKDTLSWSDHSQPRLVQLGAKLYDVKGRVAGAVELIIKPDGWSIEPGAEAVHGISEYRAGRYGVSEIAALLAFKELAEQAETIVAHNVEFDWKVIAAAIQFAGGKRDWWIKKRTRMLCTMVESANACQLPAKFGGEFKWPSLQEAHTILLPGLPFIESHRAGDDVDACERILQELIRRGDIRPPLPTSGVVAT